MDKLSQLFSYPKDSLLLAGEYNSPLVALSVLIAILASTQALALADEARHRIGRQRQIALLTGSIALGTGIWAMHFIGMLAFALCTTVSYSASMTLLSVLPGMFASWVALAFISRHHLTIIQLLSGGVLVGSGIGAMHYSGMAAMTMSVQLRYSATMFLLSILVAVLLAILALWIRFGVNKLKFRLPLWGMNVIGGTVMGCAITGMHYTGMAAARFVAPADFVASNEVSQSTVLALSVAFVTVVVGCLILTLNLLLKYRQLSIKKQASAGRLQAIMHTSVDAIVSIDYNGMITNSNSAAERILGWSMAELKQHQMRLLLPEPYRSEYIDYFSHYQRTGQSKIAGVEREIKLLHKSGHLVPVRMVIGHVQLPEEKIMVAFISDISQRLQVEQALRDREAQFRSLIGNIPGAAYRCLVDEHWSMVFISQAVEDLTGYPASDFVLPEPKRTFAGLIHPDDQDMIRQIDFTQPFVAEYRITHRDGSVRWVFEHGNSIKDEQGTVQWLDGFIMDISARKLMENSLREAREQAEYAAAARATFMANMSHEIRTPMNAVLGFTDILLGTELNSEQQKYLSNISGAARSLLHLLNDVLDSAKLDKGKLELETVSFSLRQLLDNVVSTLWIQARQKALQLQLVIADDTPEFVSGARDRLRQVLLNLVGNAIKFTEQGSVTVTVSRQNTDIRFDVTDTGIGIAPERLAQIFEPFTQADASKSRRFGGTGLGTTISKQLVELMGGTIHATSELGRGSCFSFQLSLPGAEHGDADTQLQISLKPLHILIADDIAQNLELLSILLKRAGHQVDAVMDGEQVLARLQQHSYDVVVLDSQMPVLDGLSAARQRRLYEQQHKLPAVPMVVLTASVLQEDRIAARNAGIEGFASKPVDIDALQLEIARVLKLNVKTMALAQPAAISSNAYFNLAKGVALWGTQEDYIREVGHFLAQYKQWPEQLVVALSDEQFSALEQQAHTVKGLSGHLAISVLSRLCSQLEQGSQRRSGTGCRDAISAIQALFGQLRYEYLALEQHAATTKSAIRRKADLIPVLQLLQLAAQKNEFDDSALEVLQLSGLQQQSALVSQVLNAFNDFNFDLAYQLLLTLEQQLVSGGHSDADE